MSKERGNGKTKKVVIGVATVVAVAAIAVPTALTLTGGKDDAGASTSNNKYNIIVSAGIDNVPDYSLSIQEGTKIGELKTILKAIDGYSMEGIYKDEAMQHAYSDEDTITSSTKIYIKFVAVTYTVNIYSEDGTTLLTTQEVSHKDTLTLDTPTKPEDEFATYEFKGWYNERNEQVNLNEITSDLNIHPYFETHMKEYKIGFIYEAFKSSISVSIGGEPVTLESTYHYGAKIVIRATQNIGRDITEFKVNVGGTTTDVLTEHYRHEENGQVYYEIELTGNGDLSITYNEAASEYSLGEIPEAVSVTRNGHSLTSNDSIYYGDELIITYTLWEDCTLNEFRVEGANLVSGNTYSVIGNIEITYDYTYAYSYLDFQYFEVNGGYSVIGLNDNSVIDVVIPETYRGKKVVCLSSDFGRGFNGKTKIKSIKIPSTIISIGIEFFYGCSGLTSVDLSETSMTQIQYNTFAYCSNLTEVKLPSSISEIFPQAFYGCTSLTEITIPSGIIIIEESAFANCTNLTSVTIESSEIYKATIGTETSVVGGLLANATEIRVPKDIVENNTNLYLMSNEFDYTIENGYYVIVPNEYSYLTFTETTGGYEVTGFDGSVSEVIIPSIYKGKKVIGIKTNNYNNGVFDNSNITSVTISEGVEHIGAGAFSNCVNLKSIVIPSTLTSIDSGGIGSIYACFYNCISLSSISVALSNPIYTSRDLLGNEINSLINRMSKRLIFLGVNNTEIPSDGSVISLSYYSIHSKKTIVIPSCITTITTGPYFYVDGFEFDSVIIESKEICDKYISSSSLSGIPYAKKIYILKSAGRIDSESTLGKYLYNETEEDDYWVYTKK